VGIAAIPVGVGAVVFGIDSVIGGTTKTLAGAEQIAYAFNDQSSPSRNTDSPMTQFAMGAAQAAGIDPILGKYAVAIGGIVSSCGANVLGSAAKAVTATTVADEVARATGGSSYASTISESLLTGQNVSGMNATLMSTYKIGGMVFQNQLKTASTTSQQPGGGGGGGNTGGGNKSISSATTQASTKASTANNYQCVAPKPTSNQTGKTTASTSNKNPFSYFNVTGTSYFGGKKK
jgi:hypothetical protein